MGREAQVPGRRIGGGWSAWVVGAAALLAGCSGDSAPKSSPVASPSLLDYVTPGKVIETPMVPALYPDQYKVQIANFMRTWLENAGKVKDAFVAQPVLRPMSGTQLYVTCVRYNSRTNGGQYIGDRTNLVIFLNGSISQFVENDPAICGSLSYQRYPELEKLGPPA